MSLFRILPLFLLVAGPFVLSATAQTHPIYKLEERLMRGDKTALWEIAPYFDNKEKIIEYLGRHWYNKMLHYIAKRIVSENCLFTNEEITIDTSTTAKQFTSFLNSNEANLTYSSQAAAFLITPLEKRKAKFQVRTITEARRKQLLGNSPELMTSPWIHENNIDSFIQQKDPKALLLIASDLYRNRSRHDRYHFEGKEYIDLINILTETEVGVENEQQKIEWHIANSYYQDARLNLLVYFSNHYSQYTWDNERNVFVNPTLVTTIPDKEEALFQLLDHKNNELAIDAFIQLTTCDPEKVSKLADEYQKASVDFNIRLPTFTYKFLPQLSLLTTWCRNNKISYTLTGALKEDIDRLKTELTFKERRLLEDKLINTLTLEDITAFEYEAAVHERSWGLTYSAGRILDIFYSRNWNQLVADKKHLDCYLKKSAFFNRLGIIGVCNKYPTKFSHASAATLSILANYPTLDKDIEQQAAKAVALNQPDTTDKTATTPDNRNEDQGVPGLQRKLARLTSAPNTEENSLEITTMLSKISYEQIPIALKSIEDYEFKYKWQKYSFMKRDWGFFLLGDLNLKEAREAFLQLYAKYSEYQLYAYYLDQAGIPYKKTDSTLDYDNIYEMLKYDVVTAFVGGGGGKADNEVYPLIKLLELTFKTQLGFPRKYCQSNNTNSCSSDDRAKAWMHYLRDNKLLTKEHNDPVSFTYE